MTSSFTLTLTLCASVARARCSHRSRCGGCSITRNTSTSISTSTVTRTSRGRHRHSSGDVTRPHSRLNLGRGLSFVDDAGAGHCCDDGGLGRGRQHHRKGGGRASDGRGAVDDLLNGGFGGDHDNRLGVAGGEVRVDTCVDDVLSWLALHFEYRMEGGVPSSQCHRPWRSCQRPRYRSSVRRPCPS